MDRLVLFTFSQFDTPRDKPPLYPALCSPGETLRTLWLLAQFCSLVLGEDTQLLLFSLATVVLY